MKKGPAQLLATKCEHTDQRHAALGLCLQCYDRDWMRRRKLAAKKAAKALAAQPGAVPVEPKKSKKK